MSASEEPIAFEHPSRTEVAEYVHDMAGQLAEMAERSGLTAAAALLRSAQLAIEGDF